MPIDKKHSNEIKKLISSLDKDRTWLLEQIDRGNWPELRIELAALERELSQLLNKVAEQFEE